jgi:hypothetical protein
MGLVSYNTLNDFVVATNNTNITVRVSHVSFTFLSNSTELLFALFPGFKVLLTEEGFGKC